MNLSRRNLLGAAAVAPLAAFLPEVASGAGRAHTSKTKLTPRERIQQMHLPNVPLVTQDGRQVHFYDDLVKNKIVTINFFYTHCDEICPLVTANLVKVQKLLGDRVGKDVFMHSITLKPEDDTPEQITKYAQSYHVKPGWTFYTGKSEDIERLRKGLGFTYPEPQSTRIRLSISETSAMATNGSPYGPHARGWLARKLSSSLFPGCLTEIDRRARRWLPRHASSAKGICEIFIFPGPRMAVAANLRRTKS